MQIKCPMFLALTILSMHLFGQTTHIIRFDTSGKLKSTIPERVDKNDKITFLINEPEETFSLYCKKFTEKVTKAQKMLDKIRNTEKDTLLFDYL